jgi:anti-anti-sigma factor
MSLMLVSPHPPARRHLDPPIFTRVSGVGGPRRVWLHIAGELDIASLQLEQTRQRAELHGPRVELDLQELTFMDSSGVHVIVNGTIRARRAGGRLTLVHVSRQVHRILTRTGAGDVVEIGGLEPIDMPERPVLRAAA